MLQYFVPDLLYSPAHALVCPDFPSDNVRTFSFSAGDVCCQNLYFQSGLTYQKVCACQNLGMICCHRNQIQTHLLSSTDQKTGCGSALTGYSLINCFLPVLSHDLYYCHIQSCCRNLRCHLNHQNDIFSAEPSSPMDCLYPASPQLAVHFPGHEKSQRLMLFR